MSNPFPAIALSALAAALLPSCETVRTVKSVESIGASQADPLSQRFVGQSLDKWEEGERHAMDRQRIDTTDLFGGSRDNSQFGSNNYRSKRFAGNKTFTGNRKYQPEGYQFIRDREMAREEAAAASKSFGEASKAAGEAKRGWFGRNKTIASQQASGYEGSVERSQLRDASEAQKRTRDSQVDILNPVGSEHSPKELSIEEMRTILGR